jgi:uncharacterized protein (TIGR04222 family)
MLTMPGKEFLLLYAITAVLVYVLVSLSIARRERRTTPEDSRQIRDPYSIAYLRGGARELLKVVALSLTLRGRLKLEDNELHTVESADPAPADVLPIEQAVLRACAEPAGSEEILRSAKAATAEYKSELKRRHLLAGREVYVARTVAVLLATAALVALAAAKIVAALAAGHENIEFLLVLAFVAVFFLARRVPARLTQAGKDVLKNVRGLFGGLKQQRGQLPDSAVGEATLLAAVFGMYSLPGGLKEWNTLWRSEGGEGPDADGDSGSDSGGGDSSGCGGCGGGGD